MLNVPWVEKYRPTNFNNIVLDNVNRQILKNIIELNHFPNMLFYGPPGTGKTTTIINIINEYQITYDGEKIKENVIHLNASDERGIDVIRGQIQQFVTSSGLFKKGTKFVILDEVDSMTKVAQQALKMLIQETANVKYCLICNYISRIDASLQDTLVMLRFNELPPNEILEFLKNILVNEHIDDVYDTDVKHIINIYKSDIRSMINYIQCNHRNLINSKIFNVNTIETFIKTVSLKKLEDLLSEVETLCQVHNISKPHFIKQLIRFSLQANILNTYLFRDIIHNLNINPDYLLPYLLLKIKTGDILL